MIMLQTYGSTKNGSQMRLLLLHVHIMARTWYVVKMDWESSRLTPIFGTGKCLDCSTVLVNSSIDLGPIEQTGLIILTSNHRILPECCASWRTNSRMRKMLESVVCELRLAPTKVCTNRILNSMDRGTRFEWLGWHQRSWESFKPVWVLLRRSTRIKGNANTSFVYNSLSDVRRPKLIVCWGSTVTFLFV